MRGGAIRPVPRFAVVGRNVLESVEAELARDDEGADIDAIFARFEATQPELASRVSAVLDRRLDHTALALGYFLTMAIWLAFERAFKDNLVEANEDVVRATDAALHLEEELRASSADEPFELDDVVAQEQPDVMAFVHDHLEAALSADASENDVDIDDVHLVYRLVLLLTLSLSHSVRSNAGPVRPAACPEPLA